jgi:uncharacterized protein (TIGR03086 family)
MTTSLPSPVDDLRRVLDAVQPLVDGVREEQWIAPTPCVEWNVRTLLNHVVTGNQIFEATVRGTPPPDRTVDHLGDDPSAAFRDSGDALIDAFTQPGVLEGTYPSPLGDQPGSFLVHMRITETLVHGWDLARATAQPAALPEDLARHALAVAERGMANRPRMPAMFGEAQPAPADAPTLDRLAAFLGGQV